MTSGQQLKELQKCQQQLLQVDIEIKQRIAAIADLHDCTRHDLDRHCSEVKQRLKTLSQQIDSLNLIAKQVRNEADRRELLSQIEQHRTQMERSTQSLRHTALIVVQRIEEESRNVLFHRANSEEVELRQRNRQMANIRDETTKTTESLNLLVSRMSDQLKLTQDTTTTLVDSSATLRNTETEFATMDHTIRSGGKLLSKYSRRECTDKMLIALALVMYFLVVFYILRKRVLSVFNLY